MLIKQISGIQMTTSYRHTIKISHNLYQITINPHELACQLTTCQFLPTKMADSNLSRHVFKTYNILEH